MYTINQSLTSTGTCININTSNVVIEGSGVTITGSINGDGFRNFGGYDNVTIKNVANITNFSIAINFQGGTNSTTIQNVTITGAPTDTAGAGMGVALQSSSSGSVIANSTIITTGKYGHGITNGSSGLTVSTNSINVSGSESSGIVFDNDCSSCVFQSNTIVLTNRSEGTTYGISVFGTGMSMLKM